MRSEIDSLLEAAQLSLPPEERATLAAHFADLKPAVDRLYAVPEARYESPALVFQAAPKLAAWGDM